MLQRFHVKYCGLWRSIGLELGLQTPVLSGVGTQYLHSQTECFRVTLDKWLQMNNKGTWGELELAITNANRISLGFDPFSSGEYSYILIMHMYLVAQ